MIVGPKNTLFLDEISTGLDSSTTFLIVRCTRNFAHTLQVRSMRPLASCVAALSHKVWPDLEHAVSRVSTTFFNVRCTRNFVHTLPGMPHAPHGLPCCSIL